MNMAKEVYRAKCGRDCVGDCRPAWRVAEDRGRFWVVAAHAVESLDENGDELPPGATFEVAGDDDKGFDTEAEAKAFMDASCR